MRVLVTRPEPDASRTASYFRDRGHEVVVDPILTVDVLPLPEFQAESFSAVAFTSATAARIVGANAAFDSLRALPLFAVGGRTAEAARMTGFRTVHDADGDAAAIAALIARSLAPGSHVLHLSGEERARDLGVLLAPSRIELRTVPIYRMRPAQAFGPAASALAGDRLDAALHFSARSAATFVALAEREGLGRAARALRHLCLSAAVAAPLAAFGANTEVAARPREDSLASLLDV